MTASTADRCDRTPCWCRSSYAWPPGPPRTPRGHQWGPTVFRWTPDLPALRFPPAPPPAPAPVGDVIAGARYGYRDEHDLQAGLAQVLTAAGHHVTREVRLAPRDRVDLLAGRTAVEVKVAGTVDRVHAQLARYAASNQVDDLVLVTTRARHRGLPDQVGGKPLRVVVLGGAGR